MLSGVDKGGFLHLGRVVKPEVLVTRFENLSKAASPSWMIIYVCLSLPPDSRSPPRFLGHVFNTSPGSTATESTSRLACLTRQASAIMGLYRWRPVLRRGRVGKTVMEAFLREDEHPYVYASEISIGYSPHLQCYRANLATRAASPPRIVVFVPQSRCQESLSSYSSRII